MSPEQLKLVQDTHIAAVALAGVASAIGMAMELNIAVSGLPQAKNLNEARSMFESQVRSLRAALAHLEAVCPI